MKHLISIMICSIAAGAALAQTTKPAGPTLETYTSEENGFKMPYLSTWKVQKGAQPWIIVAFAAPDGSPVRSRAAVAMPPMPLRKPGDPIKLDDVAKALVDQMQRDLIDTEVIVSAEDKLGGEKAHRMILKCRNKQNEEVKLMVLAAAHDDKGYAIGVIAPAEEWERSTDSFNRLMTLFEFIKKKN